MQPTIFPKGARVLVVGLGITGYSVVRYLSQQNIDVWVTDDAAIPTFSVTCQQHFPKVNCCFGGITVPVGITHIILSPGVCISEHAVLYGAQKRGIPIWGDIELFARLVNRPVIAITGSNGKTTVTHWVTEMGRASGFNVAMGGNVGIPALDLLNPQVDYYVLELSSYQLEQIQSLRPLAATVLNLSPDHLDRHGTMENYLAAKLRIYQNVDYAVCNRKQPETVFKHGATVTFGPDAPISAQDFGITQYNQVNWLTQGNTPWLQTDKIQLRGQHNLQNALAASALAWRAGFSKQAICRTLETFKGLPHRCEVIGTFKHVLWVNDSKGTNIGASIAALEGLSDSIAGRWGVVLGGVTKGATFEELVPVVQRYGRFVIAFGPMSQCFMDLFEGVMPCFYADSIQSLVRLASQYTEPGDGVLFSPACASFDMFKNYCDRGEQFKVAVNEYFKETIEV